MLPGELLDGVRVSAEELGDGLLAHLGGIGKEPAKEGEETIG